LIKRLRAKVVANNKAVRLEQRGFAKISFAAPMVGASPDNIGAQRLAEGGVPTSGAGSAKAEVNQCEPRKNWNLTPINSTA
jgi:hypothetical protein